MAATITIKSMYGYNEHFYNVSIFSVTAELMFHQSSDNTCLYHTSTNGKEITVSAKDARSLLSADRIWVKFSSDCFIYSVKVKAASYDEVVFPIDRVLKGGEGYKFSVNDTFLPQNDPEKEQRKKELEERKNRFRLTVFDDFPLWPSKIEALPREEKFTKNVKWYLATLALFNNFVRDTRVSLRNWKRSFLGNWPQNFKDLRSLSEDFYLLHPPEEVNAHLRAPERVFDHWKSDKWFGYQRLNGVDPMLVTRVKSLDDAVIKKFFSEETKTKFLEEIRIRVDEHTSLDAAIKDNKIFMLDLQMMEDVPFKPELYHLPCPVVLMYQLRGDLIPLCIRLSQRELDHKTVFFSPLKSATIPEEHDWLCAKLWYNLAEQQHHQSLSHLGFTHLVIATIAVAVKQNLSMSHPVHRLLAPHFLFLLAINSLAEERLINVGGFIDNLMTIGRQGLKCIIGKKFQEFSLDRLSPIQDMTDRGVYDPNDAELLPKFYYRDDSIKYYQAIRTYVEDTLKLFYVTETDLANDTEIQEFGKTLARATNQNGGGFKLQSGQPWDGKIGAIKQLIDIVASVIYTSSVQHAAVNFPQYEMYSFPPNYPTSMLNVTYNIQPGEHFPSEEEMAKSLVSPGPKGRHVPDVLEVLDILSRQVTNKLGTFETQYLHSEECVAIADRFRDRLKKIGDEIQQRNMKITTEDHEDFIYDYLLPEHIPNAISI